ncbi:MAG TPA: GTPase HflX [Thermoanaerobaculia bacterium]|nr:GTPase HflX [Thermoanaerobaculia bacterium]
MSTSRAVRREKAIAVGVILPEVTRSVVEEHLEELAKLIESAGGEIGSTLIAKRNGPDPATYVGSGKAEEIAAMVTDQGVRLVVFDDDLSPAQTRNLEKIIPAKVMDRSGLILDIFARRARSRESKTQVELAQMSYLLPRLTKQWSHLSRQAGGIGTRGVGETQLESDRRIVRERISRLKDDLKKIERTRETQRQGRKGAFTVALVGYTNAGKSTLFNQLTSGDAEAVDRLFATLDSRLHKIRFEMPRETVIIDTVGFIRKLPHHLVASFRSTMEEAVSADLALHVIDASHPQFEDQRVVGEQVLEGLGVLPTNIIEVYNKVDRIEEGIPPNLRKKNAVSVSALTGAGISTLVGLIRERELAGGEMLTLEIPVQESKLLARLHEVGEIFEKSMTGEVTRVTAWIPSDAVHQFDAWAVPGAEAKRPA